MNAMLREGPRRPIKLDPEDFEVDKSELLTQTTTVIMVDLVVVDGAAWQLPGGEEGRAGAATT